MSGPLTGRTILVTRPAHQASDLVNPLEALGAKTFNLPAIEIAPGSASALDGVVERLGEFDWIVLTSVNGVTALASKLKERGVTWPPGPRLAVIGPATGEAAAASIKPPDAMPTEYVSEEIVGALGEVQDKRILLLRADRARKELAVRLRELGALVEEVAAYHIVAALEGDYDLPDEAPDVIALTSSACVTGTVANLQARGKEHWMTECALVCIGPITAQTVIGLGSKPAATAKEYTIPGLIGAIVELVGTKEAVR